MGLCHEICRSDHRGFFNLKKKNVATTAKFRVAKLHSAVDSSNSEQLSRTEQSRHAPAHRTPEPQLVGRRSERKLQGSWATAPSQILVLKIIFPLQLVSAEWFGVVGGLGV